MRLRFFIVYFIIITMSLTHALSFLNLSGLLYRLIVIKKKLT